MILRFVLAAYVAALATMPFAHHDIVCHLKSNTHCSTCHVGTSADPSAAQPALASADFADAGAACDRGPVTVAPAAISPSSGRAPPAPTTSRVS